MEEEKEAKMQTIELTPFERVVIVTLLPQQASRHKGMLIEQIKDKLSLTDEEISAYNVNYLRGGGVEFGNNGRSYSDDNHPAYIKSKKFEFPEQKLSIITKAFKDADSGGRLPVDKKVHNLFDKVTSV